MTIARHALTKIERQRAAALARDLLPIDPGYADFADGVVAAIAANRAIAMAMCAVLLTTPQAEKVLATAEIMADALRIDGDVAMQDKLRAAIAGHVAAFRRAV